MIKPTLVQTPLFNALHSHGERLARTAPTSTVAGSGRMRGWEIEVATAAVGATMGYWMFAVRGALLFGGVGLAAALLIRLGSRYSFRVVVATALVLAALAFRSSSRLGWGAADALDGTRFKVSPVGMSHVLTPQQLVSETVDCGWHSASGYPTPCVIAADGQDAFTRLKAVYPLSKIAILLCAVAGAIAARRSRGSARTVCVLAATSAIAGTSAVILFAYSFGDALQELRGLTVGTGGTLGTMQLTAAILLCVATALHAGRAASAFTPELVGQV
jgi:hypothetical protein